MLARKWYGALCTLFIIVVPLGLYLVFVAFHLTEPWNYVAICVGYETCSPVYTCGHLLDTRAPNNDQRL